MSDYRYSLRKLDPTMKAIQPKTLHFISGINNQDEVIPKVYEALLYNLRRKRFLELLNDEDHGELYSNGRKFLANKCYRVEEMACMYEVVEMYEISGVKLISNCYGCLNYDDLKEAHTRCPTGCSHKPCYKCGA